MAKKEKKRRRKERETAFAPWMYVSFLLVFLTIIKKIVKILVNVLTIPPQSQ
jgi:hypothetical protein